MKQFTIIPISFFLAAVFLMSDSAFALPYEPTYGSATIDGSASEWDLTNDFFANMYRAGDPTKPIESKLYLRYYCTTQSLFALVLSETQNVLRQAEDAFVKLGNSIKLVDGTDPTFSWVPPSGINGAFGWEASMSLAPGSYTNLNVHTQVFSDGESQTSAVEARTIPLDIVCNGNPDPDPDPITPGAPVPEPSTVLLMGLSLIGVAGIRRKRSRK